jgi:hypothetical protein
MSNIFKNNNNRFKFLDESEFIKDKIVDKNNKKNNQKDNLIKDNSSLRKNYFKENNGDKKNMNTNEFNFIENKNERKKNNYGDNNVLHKEPVIIKNNNENIIIKEEFPELSSKHINLEVSTKIFKKLFDIKEENDKNKDDIQEEKIPDGCICISYNKMNRQIEYKQGQMKNINKITVQETMYKISKFYEKRKQKYIDLWGLDMYEDIFLFKNYDYEYFDKLDIQYEIEMEKLNEEINLEEKLESIDDSYY